MVVVSRFFPSFDAAYAKNISEEAGTMSAVNMSCYRPKVKRQFILVQDQAPEDCPGEVSWQPQKFSFSGESVLASFGSFRYIFPQFSHPIDVCSTIVFDLRFVLYNRSIQPIPGRRQTTSVRDVLFVKDDISRLLLRKLSIAGELLDETPVGQ